MNSPVAVGLAWRLRRLFAIAALFFVIASGLAAQSEPAAFEGVFFTAHSVHGYGVELHFLETDMTPESQESRDALILFLCRNVPEDLVTAIRTEVGDEMPGYFGIRLKSGGFIGTYQLTFFEYDDGNCGDEIP